MHYLEDSQDLNTPPLLVREKFISLAHVAWNWYLVGKDVFVGL